MLLEPSPQLLPRHTCMVLHNAPCAVPMSKPRIPCYVPDAIWLMGSINLLYVTTHTSVQIALPPKYEP